LDDGGHLTRTARFVLFSVFGFFGAFHDGFRDADDATVGVWG